MFPTVLKIIFIDFIQCLSIHDQNENLPDDVSEADLKIIKKYCFETLKHNIVCVKHTEFNFTFEDKIDCPELACSGSTWELADDSDEQTSLWDEIVDCHKKSGSSFFLESIQSHKYVTWGFVGVLILVELVQICGKLFTGRISTYFSRQNFFDNLILLLTFLYFVSIEMENYTASGHFGGWALFFTCMNFTFILSKIPMFGRSVFISLNVAISICKVFVVFIPSLIAFAFAFHFFMHGDPIFRSYGDGILKVIVMIIGEFDFEDHFEWYKVLEMGGAKWSVQVCL